MSRRRCATCESKVRTTGLPGTLYASQGEWAIVARCPACRRFPTDEAAQYACDKYEQVYGFIHEQDHALLDDALRDKVVFCSPLTLFAVLAVIRQAVDNFRLSQTSHEILELTKSLHANGSAAADAARPHHLDAASDGGT